MREGDFDRLYTVHAQDLFGFLVYRTGDRALAEELLADTFERVLTARRGHDRRRGSEKTWLYAIALNRVRDHARRAGAEARALERVAIGDAVAADGASDPLTAIEDREQLAPALARLTAEEREAVALRFGADMTVPEIADVLGEKLTTIEGRVYRALRKLREQLAAEPRAIA